MMMKSIASFCLVLVVLFACQREKVEYVGPGYSSAQKGFVLSSFKVDTSIVDFTLNPVNFSATFTSAVTWVITITGHTSKAVRTIQGTSTNGFSNIKWRGEMDGPMFFRKGEIATATLSFFGTTLTSSITILVAQVQNYETCGTFALFGDFETSDATLYTRWYAFNTGTPKIVNVAQGIDSMVVDYNGNVVPSVQGTRYYYMKGLGDQPAFVSGVQYTGAIKATGPGFTSNLPADPTQVWINYYIYGTGDLNAQVDLEFGESDITGKAAGNQGTDDDTWVAHIPLKHKGWKLFSIRYSDLVITSNLDFGGLGNHIKEPNRIYLFDMVLLKVSDPNSPVEVYFDYPIITVGGPFKPCM